MEVYIQPSVWNTYQCSGCSSACGVLVTATGTISDGPSDYSNDADCRWLIAPMSTYIITITFTQFNTEQGYDFVTLSSCTSASCSSKQQLLRHSGSSLPSPLSFTSYTGFLMVEFKSDRYGTGSGFTATWTVSSLPFKAITLSNVISITIEG